MSEASGVDGDGVTEGPAEDADGGVVGPAAPGTSDVQPESASVSATADAATGARPMHSNVHAPGRSALRLCERP